MLGCGFEINYEAQFHQYRAFVCFLIGEVGVRGGNRGERCCLWGGIVTTKAPLLRCSLAHRTLPNFIDDGQILPSL